MINNKMEKRLNNYPKLDIKIKHIDLDIENLLNDVSLGGGDMFGEKEHLLMLLILMLKMMLSEEKN